MANPQLIAGVDSLTQSIKVVNPLATAGEMLLQGWASEPDATAELVIKQ